MYYRGPFCVRCLLAFFKRRPSGCRALRFDNENGNGENTAKCLFTQPMFMLPAYYNGNNAPDAARICRAGSLRCLSQAKRGCGCTHAYPSPDEV